MKYNYLNLVIIFCMISTLSFSQINYNGTVQDEEGEPLVGATVQEYGNESNGMLTDLQGHFSIQLPSEDSKIKLSYIGSESMILSIKEIENQTITLQANTLLDEVVVTALGITREKKSLPYAIQEVDGSQLVQAEENNLSNALSGKVAGLQVARGSNGPGSSSKIVLRGMASLSNDNQPLIVVDGIPMSNFTGADSNDFWNASPDLGNGLADLNPNDIESISVLKGGAAAALYGSRAGNGVILVTTKKGHKSKGLGITYSTSMGFEGPFTLPKYQKSFGQGEEGIFDNISNASWGPKVEGQEVEAWDGQMIPLSTYNNMKDYLRSGFRWTNNLSFQQNFGESTSMFSSISYLDDKSMLQNVSLERLNITTRAISSFGKNKGWNTDVKLQYINNNADNRPFNGHPTSLKNTSSVVYLMPTTMDVTQFSQQKDEYGNMIWFRPSAALNPYWGAYNDLNHDSRDRFLLSGSLSNQLTDWLTSEIRAGADIYSTKYDTKTNGGGPKYPTGAFSVKDNNFNETNISAMLTATDDNLFSKFGGVYMLGGNLMHTKYEALSINAGQLEVPDFFDVNNSLGNPVLNRDFSKQKINSLYGQLSMNYDTYLFFEFTGRNDWSSTLSKENRSYFYPSFSSTFVFSELMENAGKLPSWFEFGKLRFSYAQVGNSLGPFELVNFYNINSTPNGVTSASRNNVLYNPDLVSELNKTLEGGFETRFLEGRMGLDLTIYKSNATNQLINLPLNPLSGYEWYKANAGDIQNKGFEFVLDGRVVDKETFQYTTVLNWSNNKNKILKLTNDVSQINLLTLDNMSIVAAEGEVYGQIWGSKYRRVEDEASPHHGKIVVDADGIPLAADGRHLIGEQQPSALLGLNNDFYVKGFNFGFLLDGRFGGEIYSGTNQSLKYWGLAKETGINDRQDFVFEGVVDDGSGGYQENTTAVQPQLFWQSIMTRSGNLGINEENIYDASNIRLRNIYANYNVQAAWVQNLNMKNLKLGFSMNNVWMISSHLNGVDPESIYATSSNALGYESLSAPTSRTFFINLNAGF